MKILEMKQRQDSPFEIEDEKIKKLLLFYLHYAPTIDSRTAYESDKNLVKNNWNNFCKEINTSNIKIYNSRYRLSEKIFSEYLVDEEQVLNRKLLSIVCIKKNKEEEDYECILRHIRNSIAHNNIYIANVGNRKYILVEDYNQKKVITARMLLSQTVLTMLKKLICVKND